MKKKSIFKKSANNYLIYTKKQRGITLIALVVTIVILIILASISIGALFGDSGVINKANDAKEMSEVAQEKDKLKLAIYSANVNSSNESQMTEEFDKALKSYIGEGKYVLEEQEDYYYVTFTESGRKYKVYLNGEIYRRRRNRKGTTRTINTKCNC